MIGNRQNASGYTASGSGSKGEAASEDTAYVRRDTRVRVTMITSLPPARGISSYGVPLLRSLGQRDDLDVEAIGFSKLYPARLYPGGESETDTAFQPLPGVRARNLLSWSNPLSWLRAGFGVSGDVVHAQWWSQVLAPIYVTVLGIAKLRRKRIVVTVHNVSAHEPARWKAMADRAVIALADRLVVHTSQNASALETVFPRTRGRIDIVPMGPQDVPKRRGVSREEARANLGLESDQPTILFFGNIRPYKGLDVLLRAFRDVRERLPDACLLIVGQPWAGSREVATAVEGARSMPGTILRLEYVPDAEVEDYFAAADVTVFPYKGFEAQSGAGARAVAFGRAMVVTNEGGLTSLVLDDRAVVPAGDADALARALIDVLGNDGLRSKLEADAVRVASQLDWTSIAARTAATYRRLPREAADNARIVTSAARETEL